MAPSPQPTSPRPPYGEDPSSLEEAVSRIGDRWSILVVDALLTGPQRFADLEQSVRGVSPNVLSRRLKDLEANGVIESVPYSERPRRVQYQLTVLGQDLAPVLQALTEWGAHLVEEEGDDAEVHYA